MKRCRDDPIFGPVPVYVVNEEQTAYAERIAKKFVANKIPAAVVPIHDRCPAQMHVLPYRGCLCASVFCMPPTHARTFCTCWLLIAHFQEILAYFSEAIMPLKH